MDEANVGTTQQRRRYRLGFATSYRQYYVAVALTVIAVAIAALVLLLTTPSLASPLPPSEDDHIGPSRLNGFMAVAGVVIALWGITVRYRCSGTTIRQHLTTATALLVFMPLLPLLRYRTVGCEALSNLYWYAYYVPMLYVPTLLMFCALRAAALDVRRRAIAAMRISGVTSVLLATLVLTNQLHGLAFSHSSSDGTYTYGPLYWVVLAFIAANAIAFFGVLFHAAHIRKRWALSPLGIIITVGLVYSLGYMTLSLRFPALNPPIQFVLACMLVIEYCLDVGLFPSYMRYGQLFKALPLKVRVYTDLLAPIFATDTAQGPLSPDALQALGDELPLPRGTAVELPSDPGTQTTAYGITGGVAVLTESTQEMDRRRTALQAAHDELERGNETLRRRQEIHEALYRQQRERELFDDVTDSVLWATNGIRMLLNDLPSESDANSSDDRLRSLVLVRLLLAYCKRKSALVIEERAGSMLRADRLELVLGETMTDLSLAGIEGGALVEVRDALPAATFSIIYDCLYDFVTVSFANEEPTLMVYLHEYGENSVELRIAMECESLDVSCADELRELLGRRDVAFRLTEGDDMLKLSVVVPKAVAT